MIAHKFKPGVWVRIVYPAENQVIVARVYSPAGSRHDGIGEWSNWLGICPKAADVQGAVWVNLRYVLSIAQVNPPEDEQ